MSGFKTTDADIRDAIEDLKLALHNGHWFSEWEETFINSMAEKLDDIIFTVSERQADKIVELRDKI